MTMQYDVQSIHLNSSGFGYMGRTRVKGLAVSSTSTGGTITLWDTNTAPVAATYERAGTGVAITKTSHGLSNGDRVGCSFQTASGVSATNGNYTVTVINANTFAITDINSGTIVAGTACAYVTSPANGSSQWHFSMDTVAAGTTNVVIPGEGILIETALYVTMTATQIPAASIFYA